MKPLEKNYKRIVVKIGSSLFYAKDKRLDFNPLYDIISQIARLKEEKKEIIIVSSGAIALGMHVLGLKDRPKELSYLQAIAAIGQNELMKHFRDLFQKKSLNCAQILLTWEDFDQRSRYLNAKNTLTTLLKLDSVPVINENDTISTEEIKFGDNDRLSALVSGLVNADLLIMLSDVDGLLMQDRTTVVNIVAEINSQIKAMASPSNKKTSVGGMITKLEAAKISVDSGTPCIIANGRRKDILLACIDNPSLAGTLFLPKSASLAQRERWIAFGTKPKGKIIVDDGAKKALINKKSLLSVGVCALQGIFECGDVVSITDKQGNEFARGKACVSYRQLEKAKGKRFEKEIVHCDNLVIL